MHMVALVAQLRTGLLLLGTAAVAAGCTSDADCSLKCVSHLSGRTASSSLTPPLDVRTLVQWGLQTKPSTRTCMRVRRSMEGIQLRDYELRHYTGLRQKRLHGSQPT